MPGFDHGARKRTIGRATGMLSAFPEPAAFHVFGNTVCRESKSKLKPVAMRIAERFVEPCYRAGVRAIRQY
jgi:hypothetical protein